MNPATMLASVGGTVTLVAGAVMVPPPHPEPGYHLELQCGDVLGGAAIFGIAGAALVVTVREGFRSWRGT